MKVRTRSMVLVLAAILALISTGCKPQPSANMTGAQRQGTLASASTPDAPAQKTYTDPFAYCAATGTVDAPDAGYAGPALPDEIMQGYLKASGANPNAAVEEAFRKMTIWRCMAGQVYVCNFGANLPCNSKADTNKNPTQAMLDFCQENPDSDFIPMAVTGHATIYSWHCAKDLPETVEQISQVDAAGYLANIWYRVVQKP
jgi:hypothetical protein